MADIILEETGVSAVAITDREHVLAFTGLGHDHHHAGEKISAQITLNAIAQNRVMFADGIETPYSCNSIKDCPLGSVLVIPLRSADEVIGTVKLYESKRRLFLNINHTLGEGIARILEELILVGRYQQQKQLLTESELKLVRAQINPHFLFNALNTISAVIKLDPERARVLTGDLARFLRTNLKQNQDVTTLAQELELTHSYLQIEQARFADQLQVSINIEDKWLDYRLPSFTIQPIVENAIKHGTSQQLEAGKLSIYIENRTPYPTLIIEDNAGLYQTRQAEADGTIRLSDDGLGINIVCTRLKNMFGKAARVSIECEQNKSTRVIIPLTEAVC